MSAGAGAGDGVIAIDKPEGPTSHDVVARARRALKTRRIGHTGTLDPFASGLLLLCVGRATRLAEYLTGMPKAYEAEALLGVETDTDDLTGAVVAESDAWRSLDREAVEAAFARQQGEILQTPPAYSAKKVGGERLYAKARRGEVVEPEPVSVRIDRIAVTELDPPRVRFEVECSSGTYIRAIARDVGRALGVGAHLTALRRTRVGPHRVERAVPLDRLDDPDAVRGAWLTPLEALAGMPRADVDEAAALDLAHGRSVEAPAETAAGDAVAVAHAGELVAIARLDRGRLVPRKVFAS